MVFNPENCRCKVMITPNFLTHFMIICALPMFSDSFLNRFCKSALSFFGNPVNLLTLALLSYDSPTARKSRTQEHCS